MAKNYRTVIMCDVNNDGNTQYFEADIENPVDTDLSIDVTTHPTVNGDLVADHMIIQPAVMTLTGTFSLAGNKPTNYEGGNERLGNIQEVFEKILRNGLFCSVATLRKQDGNHDNTGKVRFLQRDNMVLKSIHWHQGNNTLGFTFNFGEILEVDVDEELYKSEADANLPTLTSAATCNFADEFLNLDQMYSMLIKMLYQAGLIDLPFLRGFWSTTSNVAEFQSKVYLALGVAGAAIFTGIVSGVVYGSLSISALWPVGTIIAGVAILCLAVAACFAALAQEAKKKKYKLKAFQDFKDDKKKLAEYSRFVDFTGSVMQQVYQLSDKLRMYGIASNIPQDCALVLDNTYYIFSFQRNNVNGKWSLVVLDYQENIIASEGVMSYKTNVSQCTPDNYLFTTPSGEYVYIMNSKPEEISGTGFEYDQKEVDAAIDDLSNYKILVTPFDMRKWNDMIAEIMKNAFEA